MSFEKSEEELRILTDTYYTAIMDYGDLQINKYVNSEMLWDSNWESLRHEPVFQMLYYDYDDDVESVTQFNINSDSQSFSMPGGDNQTLHHAYDIDIVDETNLFNLYIVDFLNSAPSAAPTDVWETLLFNKYIIDIMFEMDYFSRMGKEEVLAIYELTNDIRFVDTEVAEIFIF